MPHYHSSTTEVSFNFSVIFKVNLQIEKQHIMDTRRNENQATVGRRLNLNIIATHRTINNYYDDCMN